MKGNVQCFIPLVQELIIYFYLSLTFLYILGAVILKVTNELTIEMIKVQHWKIYDTHYDDKSLEIGMELKNAISLQAE